MSQGSIVTGDEVGADLTLSCDVCVIGSGSGGAWLAHELVSSGLEVVMLEEGGYHTRREFDMTEARAYATLYQEQGSRATDDLAVSMLQGRSVGGGTTVNWCSSFRTPERILKRWRETHGLEALTAEALTPHWEAVEERLSIKEWPVEALNRNNRVLWDGLKALGYSRGLIRRNVKGCINIGYCGMGCPVDAKQSTLVSVVPDAVRKGLKVYANASVRRLEWAGRKVSEVHADVLDPATDRPKGVRLTVKPKVTCVCGGAINSPALLLRSGLDLDGRVGRRTWLHPVVASVAMFDEPIEPFSGAPQSVYSHQFIDRGEGKVGFFLEVAPMHPMLSATLASGLGVETQDMLENLPRMNALIGLAVDGLLPHEEGATVRLRDGAYSRLSLSYAFVPETWEGLRTAQKEMAKIQFATGAKKVITLHLPPVVMHSVDELKKLDEAPFEKLRVRVLSAHQMGGCPMGKDPAVSVLDPTFRFRGMDNLFVVDGSALPTSLGVNPQQTIFGLARWASQHVVQVAKA